MNRDLLLLNILNNVATYFGISRVDEADFYMSLNVGNVDNALLFLKSVNNRTSSFLSTLYYLDILIEMEPEQIEIEDWDWTVYNVDFNIADYKHLNRSFQFKNNSYCYIHCTLLMSGLSISVANQNFVDNQKLTLQVFVSYFNQDLINTIDIDKFFLMLSSNSSNDAYILSKVNIHNNLHSVVALLYANFLANGGRLSTDNSLVYNSSALLNASNFNQTLNINEFDQYQELLDVFNAVNSTNNIIDRFMKIFNLIEYLIYRMYLVELANKTNGSRFFVRELLSINKRNAEPERAFFIKSFQELFNSNAKFKFNLPVLFTALKSNNADDFIDKNFDINIRRATNFDPGQFSKLIYLIRCSIVHSKESEFHISITNVNEYKVLIPFINEFIESCETLIFKMITSNFDKVTYIRKEIKLY